MSERLRTHGSASFDDVRDADSDNRFKLWIKKTNNKCEAVCKICNDKVIYLKTMGVCAVISHDEGDEHKRKLKNYTSMSSLMLENSSSSNSKKESSSSHNSSARVVMVNKVNVSQA